VYTYCPAPIYILYYLGQSWTMIKVGVVQVCRYATIVDFKKTAQVALAHEKMCVRVFYMPVKLKTKIQSPVYCCLSEEQNREVHHQNTRFQHVAVSS
jgi:hypothetical protein